MNHLLRRLKNRLEKCLPSSKERKILPYLEKDENDENIILKAKLRHEISFIDNFISPQPTNVVSFITSLNIECSIRQVMRTYYRCHDSSAIAHFAFTEFATHPNYSELLTLLRVRLTKSEGKPLNISLPTAFIQLKTCINEINQAIRENIGTITPLSLGDAAASIVVSFFLISIQLHYHSISFITLFF